MFSAKGGFKKLTKVEEALQVFLKASGGVRPSSEPVKLHDAAGRVLAEDIFSNVDVPPSDRAAMDGYAVVSEDTFGASPSNPVMLQVVGRVKMGEAPNHRIDRGQAIAVATGAMLPEGADAVLMVEYAEPVGQREIKVVAACTPGDNVAKVGEVVRKGQTILRKGTKLSPFDIGLLSSLGHLTVKVVRKARVAVLSTGDELLEPPQPATLGKIYDSNRPMLKALVRELGCEPYDLGIAPDNEQEISLRIREGLREADVVLVTAGSSVGEKDLVPSVVNSLGRPGMLVHGVTLRPGAPTGLAVVEGKPVVLLPGYPVSSAVSFHAFVRPLLLAMMATRGQAMPTVRARMSRRAAAGAGLRTYLRVKLSQTSGGYLAEPIRAFGAGILTTLTEADGVVIIPEEKEGVEQGEEVDVILFRPVGDLD